MLQTSATTLDTVTLQVHTTSCVCRRCKLPNFCALLCRQCLRAQSRQQPQRLLHRQRLPHRPPLRLRQQQHRSRNLPLLRSRRQRLRRHPHSQWRRWPLLPRCPLCPPCRSVCLPRLLPLSSSSSSSSSSRLRNSSCRLSSCSSRWCRHRLHRRSLLRQRPLR